MAGKGAPPGHAKMGGRAPGTPNRITTDLREAIMNAFTTVGGEAYLVRVAKKNPTVFCALLARILPLQLQASREGGSQSPALKIAETLELLRARLGPPQLPYIEAARGREKQDISSPPN
jgi:hypothetical protein